MRIFYSLGQIGLKNPQGMRFFWGCHSWFLRYVWFIFQYWYFIMETSSIHNVKPVVPFKALIGYFSPQQVLCSCCPQPRWCFPKMSNKQTLDVAHCRRDPSCGGPPDRCSQSTIPVTLLPSLTISCQFFSTSDSLIQEEDGFWLVRSCC